AQDKMNYLESFDKQLPLLPLRKGVVFPGAVTTLPVGRARSRALAREVSTGDVLVVAPQREPEVEEPGLEDLHPLGVLATVKDTVDRGARGVLLVVEGMVRARLVELDGTQSYLYARVEPVAESRGDSAESRARAAALRTHLKELGAGDDRFHEMLDQTEEPGLVADRVAAWFEVEDEAKVQVLSELDVEARLGRVGELLVEVKGRAELRQRVDEEVRRQLGDAQREAMLRHQLRAIQKELGEEGDDQLDSLRERLEEKELPGEVRKAAERELRRLEGMNPQQPEANVIRTYLEWIADLPWAERAEDVLDVDAIARVLDEDHYGLDDVKRRILEHMAVLKLAGHKRGTILCLAGAPGVGKTSLAQSVASAVGRPLVRISLGGVRDESEIRGHRRTYVGALPGRVMSALRKAGVKNPVVVLDEIDKMGRGVQGDPEAALLEVLDPEQNAQFTDHYLEQPFDLSEVMFIATANELGHLSPPLHDRLEVIELTGYTADEKVEIAKRHLIPKQVDRHGLPEDALDLSDAAIGDIIEGYTREAGVRQLERQLAKLCRGMALDWARGEAHPEGAQVGPADLAQRLGRRKFFQDEAERQAGPGVAAGLAWTPAGGDILYVETTRMPGRGRLEITGSLGDVMQESARAALAYLRSHPEQVAVEPDFLEAHDLHIHVPAGAVPKDGPSAGVTIFTALASLLSGRAVRSDTAMTGEATLRGRVLPVGGIKSKVLAAHRAGFKRVILPKRNEQDLDEVPAAARQELEILAVEDMGEVLNAALEPDGATKHGRHNRRGDRKPNEAPAPAVA
ncbi:MAG: endopeptidase La, partial [Myxococcota bacterium]